jgi:glycerate-2-kinase
VCLILGGETTVTLGSAAGGLGGRNQELALAAALQLDSAAGPATSAPSASQVVPHRAVLCLGTDGGDGPTDAAGALVTELSVRAAVRGGLSAEEHLDRHDSHSFFAALDRLSSPAGGDGSGLKGASASGAAAGGPVGPGGLIRTGPTGTNVMDLTVALWRRDDGWV